MESPKTLFYKRSQFVTHLPVTYRYTRSHFWADQHEGGRWRIGFTKFATRMLGEMVDHQFDIAPSTLVRVGDTLGWIEGFKAISDLICIGNGKFVGGNSVLKEKINLVTEANYTEGWLYELDGEIDDQNLEVEAYAEFLTQTIDRILASQKAEED